MARDYAAEYQARAERALEHGFTGYGQERGYKERNAELIEAGKEYLPEGIAYDPREAYRAGLIEEYGFGAGEIDRDEWGHLAHDIVSDYIDSGMSEGEAIAAMHELIGETP